MFSICGGSKIDLSIYSILTIIVLTLISVSVRCDPRRCRIIEGQQGGEAGLLVTVNYIEQKGNKDYEGNEIDDQISNTGETGYIRGLEIDGKALPKAWWRRYHWESSTELSPGHHKIRFVMDTTKEIQGWQKKRGREEKIVEFDVKPHAVYVLVAYFDTRTVQSIGMRGQRKVWHENVTAYVTPLKSHVRVIRMLHYYEHATGLATHPTESNLSFRVKK